jgi:hypothetical protein
MKIEDATKILIEFLREQDHVPIPVIPATQSEGFRPAVPIEGGHLFRSIPATLSERSDAGI